MNRNYKRLFLWLLLILTQLFLIFTYFYLKIEEKLTNPVSFIVQSDYNKQQQHQQHETYHKETSKIYLLKHRIKFLNFNSSLCYANGTDEALMTHDKTKRQWQCQCLQGWHGNDCGQPEIIWRALLAYRKTPAIKIKGPRQFERRLIYIFTVKYETMAEIRIQELWDTVDLFVIVETDGNYFQRKLNNNFLKDYHHKIVYINLKSNLILNRLWAIIKKAVKNLQDDDIILLNNNFNEIPNKGALTFLKMYDNWPEPIHFRLRWSVYGFFWIHPSKTVITSGACTVLHLTNVFNNHLNLLSNNKTNTFVVGDLNHFGGWYCEYCMETLQIIEYLTRNPIESQQKLIDTKYLEDLIENGIYIDGKTELIRSRKYNNNYFAPSSVLKNEWKYDNLLINFYSKLDYYEA